MSELSTANQALLQKMSDKYGPLNVGQQSNILILSNSGSSDEEIETFIEQAAGLKLLLGSTNTSIKQEVSMAAKKQATKKQATKKATNTPLPPNVIPCDEKAVEDVLIPHPASDPGTITIQDYVNAAYPLLYVQTNEETRMRKEVLNICKNMDATCLSWSITTGLTSAVGKELQEMDDAEDLFAWVKSCKEQVIILLNDMHLHLNDPDPTLIRNFKEIVPHLKKHGIVLMIVACRQVMPVELEKEFVVVDLPLPNKDEFRGVMRRMLRSITDGEYQLSKFNNDEVDTCLENAKGMTLNEAESAFSLSLIKKGKFCPEMIYREKANIVKKSGFLTIVDSKFTLDDIGGLDIAKRYLKARANALSPEAMEYGLPMAKGLLVTGIPGTGKSLMAKIVANLLRRLLVRLDAGAIFGGLVGQSEQNVRTVIRTVEAIAPCVLHIDEIEKGFGGSKGSSTTDGGTSSRVFSSFLTWMQEKTAPVYVFATANDVSALPPELLRKGRFDEMFFVDLPNDIERQEIWDIQIKKHKRNPANFDIEKLVNKSAGMTGAEVEQAFIDALYVAFGSETVREPTNEDIFACIAESKPLSVIMKENIDQLRDWGTKRARFASTRQQDVEDTKPERKLRTGPRSDHSWLN